MSRLKHIGFGLMTDYDMGITHKHVGHVLASVP